MNVLQIFCFAIFFFKFSRCSDVQESITSAYVSKNISLLQCGRLPQDNVCNINHDVILVSEETTAQMLSGASYSIDNLQKLNASKNCIKDMKDTFCSGFMKCSPNEKIDNSTRVFNDSATSRACQGVKKSCENDNHNFTTSVNCSDIVRLQQSAASLIGNFCAPVHHPRSNVCKIKGYKKPLLASENIDGMMHLVLPLKNMLSPWCYNTVLEVMCYHVTPMCSDDETKVISLISKQECKEKLTCVDSNPSTSSIRNSAANSMINEVCFSFPDAKIAQIYERPKDLIMPSWNVDTHAKHHWRSEIRRRFHKIWSRFGRKLGFKNSKREEPYT